MLIVLIKLLRRAQVYYYFGVKDYLCLPNTGLKWLGSNVPKLLYAAAWQLFKKFQKFFAFHCIKLVTTYTSQNGLRWRPGLHDIGLLFIPESLFWIRYKKPSGVRLFTRSLENSIVTLYRDRIISLRLPYLLFSLPICQAIDQPHLQWNHPIIKARFGSVSHRIMMFTRKTKRYLLYRIFFLIRSRVVPDFWSRAYRIHAEPYKDNPNPIRKGIRYVCDPVSCKQDRNVHAKTINPWISLLSKVCFKTLVTWIIKLRNFSNTVKNPE